MNCTKTEKKHLQKRPKKWNQRKRIHEKNPYDMAVNQIFKSLATSFNDAVNGFNTLYGKL